MDQSNPHAGQDQLGKLQEPLPNPRLGENIFEAANEWWPSQCLCTGDLLKFKGQFFICTGKTPAVFYATLSTFLHSLIPGFVLIVSRVVLAFRSETLVQPRL